MTRSEPKPREDGAPPVGAPDPTGGAGALRVLTVVTFYAPHWTGLTRFAQRIAEVVRSAFNGRRIVIFSGGAAKGTDEVIEEIRQINAGGGFGSIVGRNAFQRPRAEGIDLLDSTKIVPEELCPVEIIGTMTLNRRPINFFAEVERVMFNPGNLVPGIDVTNDPLLQVRLFSYIDTQITRLGGPNFNQLPINRAHCPVNDMFRDGFHQHAVHGGVAPYRPNSLDGGNPAEASEDSGAFIDVPQPVASGAKVRELSASFDDHFSQATLFVRSLSEVEREHLTRAYTFELGKCYEEAIRLRQLQCLANIDADLCAEVARGLGLPAPEPTVPPADVEPSPALSQVGGTWPIAGRKRAFVTAPSGGKLGDVVVDRTFLTAASIEFDSVLVVDAPAPAPDAVPLFDAKAGHATAGLPVDPRVAKLVAEMFRHFKAIGVASDATDVLTAAGVPEDAPGVVVGEPAGVVGKLAALLAEHRVWHRFGPVAEESDAARR